MEHEHQPHGGDPNPEATGERRTPDHEVQREYRPAIYAYSLADYDRGRRRGIWVDAHQSAEQLDAHIAETLDLEPVEGRRAWEIAASVGFAGLELPPHLPSADLSRLAAGIAEHGAAYAAWATVVGLEDNRLDRFSHFHVGTYDSPEEWAKEFAEDLNWHTTLDQAITDEMLRRYVVIDYAAMVEDGSGGWDVVPGDDGKTHVFMR